jgi:hypothetical protein
LSRAETANKTAGDTQSGASLKLRRRDRRKRLRVSVLW